MEITPLLDFVNSASTVVSSRPWILNLVPAYFPLGNRTELVGMFVLHLLFKRLQALISSFAHNVMRWVLNYLLEVAGKLFGGLTT